MCVNKYAEKCCLCYQGALLQYFNVCKVTLLLYSTVVCMWGYGTVVHRLKYHSHIKKYFYLI